ncbi:hypothetical protein BGX34_001401 [Mortierella sp. NVP85]|nr:hypothetical protein BGX34_001401 [Mortierella sp. NVP85]
MRFTIAAAAAAFMSVVMADVAYPTLPVADTVWTAGQSAPVTWRLMNPKFKTPLNVDLFTGEATKQTFVKTLGVSPAGATKMTVLVPADLEANMYSLRIGDSWTHPFVIKSKDGSMPKSGSNAATFSPKTPGAGSGNTNTTGSGSVSSAPNSANYFYSAPLAVVAAAAVAAAMAF